MILPSYLLLSLRIGERASHDRDLVPAQVSHISIVSLG